MNFKGVAAIVCVWCICWTSPVGAQVRHPQETVAVVKVLAGDSIRVRIQKKTTVVLLIGVDDTPVIRITPHPWWQFWKQQKVKIKALESGKSESTQFLKGLVYPFDIIYLEFDRKKKDKYGRLLAYAYLADGRMINELMLESGYVRLDNIKPNVRYRDQLLRAFEAGYRRANETERRKTTEEVENDQ